ncbi:GNAT family N-acetyltransferase [Spirosoma sp. SC4-14]|uniref:GNAT family N-acetyltransferase n=1 Tax=Spirosoma sp. SC4-14 TaxID=3128900 RepID=UPI0030D27A0F
MLIRTATLSDVSLLWELAVQTMREAFGPPHNSAELVEEYIQADITLPALEAELGDRRAAFFVFELPDRTPIGYAKMRRHSPPRRMPEPYRRARNAIEIQRIYLLQQHTGQGRGRMLMEHCLNWAREQGYKAVWLGVWEHNERALTFYKKMGFEPFGFHYFQFGSERQRDFWLQKQL